MTKARDLANLGAVAAYSPTFRNRIINGSGIIGQRGTVTLSGASASYGADRWLAAISGGTGVTASTFKSTFGGSTSYSGIWINGTFTGIPYFAQRIEMQNCFDLNSSYVTVSGLAYQDTGSTQQMVVRLSKANGVDNFSGITALQTGTAFSVPSGVVTAFKQTFLLGSTDASNGLQLEIFGTGSITVTSKNFAVSDVQLEKGAIATPFEVRPIGVELALCQRYYYRISATSVYSIFGQGMFYGTSNGRINIPLPVLMRAQPTTFDFAPVAQFLVEQGTGAGSTVTALSTTGNSSPTMAQIVAAGTGTPYTSGYPAALYAAGVTTAYIGIGAEL